MGQYETLQVPVLGKSKETEEKIAHPEYANFLVLSKTLKAKKNDYADAYRDKLIPQEKQIEALQWFISSGEYFYEISAPTINENAKYLKLDNNDSFITGIKTLILGDLCSLYFKKIGTDGYVIYLDRSPKFDEIIENNTILKWIQKKEEL